MKTTVRLTAYILICVLMLAFVPVPVPAETPAITDFAASVRLDMASGTAKAPAVVHAFVDGDTVHFLLAEPIDGKYLISVRFLAVNTPESTGVIEEYGKAASRFTHEKLENAVSILIESDDGQWNVDSNGTRYLAWVWYKPEAESEYRSLNIELLQNGLAKANSSAQNRYGSVCMAAIAQAKENKLGIYSGQKDPDFYYGDAIELTIRELRLHPEAYADKKVACSGVVTMNSGNSVYVEAYDAETGLFYGIPVFYGYNLSGGGMEVLHTGNEVRIVGTLQYYEAGGEYQIAGITYRMMKPDDPGNIRKLSEGHDPACAPVDPDELIRGKAVLSQIGDSREYDRMFLALATSVTMESLSVEYVRSDDDGALLTCRTPQGSAITVHTSQRLTPEDWSGKTVTVRGIVTMHYGQYRIKALQPDGLTIQSQ